MSARAPRFHNATRRAIALFIAAVLLLVLVTTLEHSAPVRGLFDTSTGAAAYLVLQSALFLAALVFSGVGCWRGTLHDRLVLAIPAALILLYFFLLASGPG